MNPEERLLLQIDLYVHNEMDDGERMKFEEKMAHDEVLKNRVEDFKKFESLFNKDILDLKGQLDAVEEELAKENFFSFQPEPDSLSSERIRSEAGSPPAPPQTEPGQVIHLRYVLVAAASVAFIIIAVWFLRPTAHQEELAMNYTDDTYLTLEGEPLTRGESGSHLDQLFNSGKYDDYIAQASLIAKDSLPVSEKKQLQMNIARSYIMTNQPQKALAVLQSYSGETGDCQAEFLKGLALLQMKNKDEAITIMKSISSRECFPFNSKAAELLGKL